jgi:ubiquinone/menaquinone biosynthesis C-methylase UbiE
MMSHEEMLPGEGLSLDKMPGHWLLARMGKRVLRPGGIELTRQMIAALGISNTDHVVEFAPGLGITAQLALAQSPATYTGVEADESAAQQVQALLSGSDHRRCVVGRAENTGLTDGSATVIYGEAMLTMQTPANKARIVQEARRLLQSGGRYGIHELCLVPDEIEAAVKDEVNQALSKVIHVGARPLTLSEWKQVIEQEGFAIKTNVVAPMHLLELPRMIQDEGISRTLRIAWNILRTPAARQRVLAMRSVFRKYASHLAAVMMTFERIN